MKTIVGAIFDLLFVRDTVVVPGMGAFVKKPTSAHVNSVANYFAAPSSIIEFDDGLRDDNDLILNYLVNENNISEEEARRWIAEFVSDCFNIFKEGKTVTLEGIGTLRYDWLSEIVLEQDVSSNFNSDSFGLSDFTAVPVEHFATKEEIKAEIEQQQKDKNTPVTVDEKLVHEDEETHHHRVWPWILLVLLFLIAVVFGLQYFRIVDFKQWLKPKTPVALPTDTVIKQEKPIVAHDSIAKPETDTILYPETDTLAERDSLEIVIEQETEELTQSEQEIAPIEDAKIMIVAGCFSVEEYAFKLEAKLKERGYQTAFVEKRGSKWFVAYGRYRTDNEAEAALAKIKADGDAKAWIKK